MLNKILSKIFLAFIAFYKNAISPLLSPACRYSPTCSEFGMQAIKKHGAFKGGWLTIKRFLSCNPWGGNGYDPVP